MFRFFGPDYAAYHRRVPSGIPFIVTPALGGDFPAPASSSTPASDHDDDDDHHTSAHDISRPIQPSYLDGVVHQSGPAAMLRRTPSVQPSHEHEREYNDHDNHDGDHTHDGADHHDE
jgi:hypothetical protein